MEVFQGSTPSAYPRIVRFLEDVDDQESRAGETKERLMIAVRSSDPRSRWMIRPGINWAFGLQECFAYWNGLNPGHVHRYNSNMEDYMTDGTLEGSAYGTRLRETCGDQIERAIEQLRLNTDSRRAVLMIHQPWREPYFDEEGDVACTIYLQLFVRDEQLHMVANLRSQDMLWGYPYDTQAFQWMQEVIAGILEVDVGEYWHIMNSCHYYTDFEEQVLESARDCVAYEFPDCRLQRNELTDLMRIMDTRLSNIRDGYVYEEPIGYRLYDDWLKVMTAYEQARFHDDVVTALEIGETIETRAFSDWVVGDVLERQ